MDSLTQIVLGGAVGEASGGKHLGNKAVLWGAIGGTIPDLDVFIMGFFHPIDAALIHRGFSHSILFAFLAGPILGYLLYLIYKKKIELKIWIRLGFLSIITHPLLDIFTTYGTELFWPYPNRIAFNTVFVIDPLYTVPFATCLIMAMRKRKEDPKRKKWNIAGLVFSTGYLFLGVVIKISLLFSLKNGSISNNIFSSRTSISPMPFTSFYWQVILEDDKNFYIGNCSIFYPINKNSFDTLPKNHHYLNNLKWENSTHKDKLSLITNNYYTVRPSNDSLFIYDLRFGTASAFTNQTVNRPIMGFLLLTEGETVLKTEKLPRNDIFSHVDLTNYLRQIFIDPYREK
jgi:inner membrane protein